MVLWSFNILIQIDFASLTWYRIVAIPTKWSIQLHKNCLEYIYILCPRAETYIRDASYLLLQKMQINMYLNGLYAILVSHIKKIPPDCHY